MVLLIFVFCGKGKESRLWKMGQEKRQFSFQQELYRNVSKNDEKILYAKWVCATRGKCITPLFSIFYLFAAKGGAAKKMTSRQQKRAD